MKCRRRTNNGIESLDLRNWPPLVSSPTQPTWRQHTDPVRNSIQQCQHRVKMRCTVSRPYKFGSHTREHSSLPIDIHVHSLTLSWSKQLQRTAVYQFVVKIYPLPIWRIHHHECECHMRVMRIFQQLIETIQISTGISMMRIWFSFGFFPANPVSELK